MTRANAASVSGVALVEAVTAGGLSPASSFRPAA
jgi:hypothetical protein